MHFSAEWASVWTDSGYSGCFSLRFIYFLMTFMSVKSIPAGQPPSMCIIFLLSVRTRSVLTYENLMLNRDKSNCVIRVVFDIGKRYKIRIPFDILVFLVIILWDYLRRNESSVCVLKIKGPFVELIANLGVGVKFCHYLFEFEFKVTQK